MTFSTMQLQCSPEEFFNTIPLEADTLIVGINVP